VNSLTDQSDFTTKIILDTKPHFLYLILEIATNIRGGNIGMRPKLLCLSQTLIITIILFTACAKIKAIAQGPIEEPEMVHVEGGLFIMGYTDQLGSDYYEDELPATRNRLTSYSISKYEVTQKLWKQVMGTTIDDQRNLAGKDFELYGQGDNYPMYYVNYDDAQEFISRLNKATSKQYRLPTEAEWEFAARGGIKSKNTKFSGSKEMDSVGWYGENSGDTVHPVGEKLPNELGIYDMSGNLYEWCSDWYARYEWGWWLRNNPTGPEEGFDRILRGGSWIDNTDRGSRVWSRANTSGFAASTGYRCRDIGIRLVLTDEQQPATTYQLQAPEKTDPSEPDMVFVLGGSFTMGNTDENDPERRNIELPPHTVFLGSFFMGRHEVTQKQWQWVMGNVPSQIKDDNLPVDNVSWPDIQRFIQKLNTMTGKRYRLPTEAEWEYAARGGRLSKGYKYAGSDNIAEVAWYRGNSEEHSHPFALKQPNELGIYDMSGNVSEWVSDYGDDYPNYSKTNPTGPEEGNNRVFRGGDFHSIPWEHRVVTRGFGSLNAPSNLQGFRLVLELGPQNNAFTEPEMVQVQGGTYKMREQADYEGETIKVGNFSIGKYEITQRQWQAVMGTSIRQQVITANEDSPKIQDGEEVGWVLGNTGDNYPMYYVNYEEAVEFCNRLSMKTGKKYRLPTEAEWEYAARGGAKSKGYVYSGSNDIFDVCWYLDNSSFWQQPVGTLQPNELGIYDMSGNVAEWCSEYPRDDLGEERAIRGGASMPDYGWNGDFWVEYIPTECTVWGNQIQYRTERTEYAGFRVVLEP